MTREWKKILFQTVERNIKGYILICAVFAVGFCTAAAMYAEPVAEEEIRLYITDFLSGFQNSGSGGGTIFAVSILSHIKFAAWMLLASFTVLGVPLVWICVFAKGFSYGTVLCSIFSVFGTKALLLIACAVVPHVIITAPSCLVYSCNCMQHSYWLFSGSRDAKRDLLRPFMSCICFLLVVCIGALIQAYLEPVLVSVVSEYFI